MNKQAGASKVTHMKSRVSSFLVLVFGFVSLGLAPAFAVDERVIDVVAVTWNGAPAPRGDDRRRLHRPVARLRDRPGARTDQG